MSCKEFDLIKKYFIRSDSFSNDLKTGIGDDAAILSIPVGHDVAISVDTLVAGIHFYADSCPNDLGYKALAVNLSDMAAMGAKPWCVTLALTLPEANENWLEHFAAGFFELADQYGVVLVGGDTTRGPLSICVQIQGLLPEAQALKRSGASVGDAIYVTGTLGDAALALKLSATAQSSDFLSVRLHRPQPRVSEGQQLLTIANSAIDISDGLFADLSHILEASGVGAAIELPLLPISRAAREQAGLIDCWQSALSGGDDYELCFTVAEDKKSELQASAIDCKQIGVIETEPGLRCYSEGGGLFVPDSKGYEHFQSD